MHELLAAWLLGAGMCLLLAGVIGRGLLRRARTAEARLRQQSAVLESQTRALRANEKSWDEMQVQSLALIEATTMMLASVEPQRGIPLAQRLARFRATQLMTRNARIPTTPPKEGKHGG